MKRILGVDPGSRTLGWGIIEGQGIRFQGVAYGCIRLSAKESFADRLLKIEQGLTEVIEKFSPDAISVEDAFYAENVKVAMKLGQIRGVVLLNGKRANLEIGEYPARLVKKTVVGYGNAEKQQVQEMVRVLLNMSEAPEPHDAADALALAICHFQHDNALTRKAIG